MRVEEEPCTDVFWQEIGMLAQAVAGASDLDDDGVVEKRVEEHGGDHGIAEDVAHSQGPRLEVRIMAPFSYRALTS